MGRLTRLAAGVALALSVAGCTGPGKPRPGPTAPPTPTRTTATTTTGPTAPATGTPTVATSPGARPSATAGRPTPSTVPVRWRPPPGASWQWQLTTPVDLNVDAAIFDIDGFSNSATVVAELHRRGRKVICYIEVGAAESFRPDYHLWPAGVLGRPNGWPGERWVDIRDPRRLDPILTRRMDMCRDKGFDAVEPDIMDHFINDTGFPITAQHQLAFNRHVARLAHERGLSVALKNDVEQVPQLVDDFDFTINEECFAHNECAALTPFVQAGKAVLHAEYDVPPATYCAQTRRLGLSSIHKELSLNAARRVC